MESEITHKLRTFLQQTLIGTQEPDKLVTVVATTNYPMAFGDAFNRRFHFIEVPGLENPRDRLQVLQRCCGGYEFGYDLSPEEWDELSLMLDGYNGSDITKLVALVRQERIDRFNYCRTFILDPSTQEWNACYGDVNKEMKKMKAKRKYEGRLGDLERMTNNKIISRPIVYADFIKEMIHVQVDPYNEMREDHKLYKAKKGCVFISKRSGT